METPSTSHPYPTRVPCADFFDKINAVARRMRRSSDPFGGIQVILCGDFFQLPPVSRGETKVKFLFEAVRQLESNCTAGIELKAVRQLESKLGAVRQLESNRVATFQLFIASGLLTNGLSYGLLPRLLPCLPLPQRTTTR